MKESQLYSLIAMIFVAISFVAEGWNKFGAFVIAFLWLMGGALLISPLERRIERLDREIERRKFELIVNLLSKKRK
jgi:hypothetical protein